MVIVSDWSKFNTWWWWGGPTVPTTNLIAEYLLDWNANDTSTNANNGTAYNMSYVTPSWSSVQVWSFNGSSSYIECLSNGFGVHNNQAFTVAAWFYRDVTWANHTIWSYDYTSHAIPYYAQHMRINSSNPLLMAYSLWWTYTPQLCTTTITSGKRRFMAMQFESWNQKIWLGDATSLNSEKTDVDTGTLSYYNQEVWIGKANFWWYYDWYIARVRAYDAYLSSSDVTLLYDEWVTLLWL